MAWKKTDESKTIEEVILRNTGYSDISKFLNGSLKVYNIKYLQEAADLIKEAIENGEQITIVGDYDADGITASATLSLTLSKMGAKVKVRLPKRLSEGYGLSTKIVDEIESGLLITVDNGIVAFDAIKKAKEKGLKVIVTDHHLLDESGKLPEADIVIDPHIPGTADFADYCGAGIAYKLAKLLIPEDAQTLRKLSCFAAIGTICDVVPLLEENRLIVREGLKNMVTYNCRTSGLYSLLRANDMDRIINEENIGFKIGPIINAAGRMYDDGAIKAYEVIVYDGPFREDLGNELIAINDMRKKEVQTAMEKLYENIQANCLFGDYPLVVYEPNIPEGIVGILAGRLAEEKGVPSFVFTDSDDPNVYKGSARSACGVHLKDLLDASSETLYKYGGHADAAGLSVEKDKYYDMIAAFAENIPEPEEAVDTSTIYYDLEIPICDVDAVLKELATYAPFGEGNPQIRFKVTDFELSPRYSSFYGTLGDTNQHLKLYGVNIDAIGFNMVEKYQGMGEPKRLNLIGTLGVNYFMGRSSVQVTLDDFADSGKRTGKTRFAKLLEEKAKQRYS